MKVSYLAMTGYEGPAPGIELWPVPAKVCDPVIAQQSFNHTLELASFADQLGFDWVSVAEHHYAAYMMSPNPVLMAAALSQVVKKAKIALLGPLVPLNNPIRLAEEVAMLDNLSNGRVVVLFLRGTPNEHITYDTPKADTRGMTQEGIDLIRKSWLEEEPFSWEGEHYQFSTVSVWPRLQQYPCPPMYGSGNSDESVVFAAQRKMGIAFSFAPPEQVSKWVALYREECAKAGWQPTADNVLYRGIACVAETDQQAREVFEGFLGAKEETSIVEQTKSLGGPPSNQMIMEPYFLGGVDTVLERFRVLHECGVGVVDMGFSIGTVEQQKAAMQVFSEQVLPVVHNDLVIAA